MHQCFQKDKKRSREVLSSLFQWPMGDSTTVPTSPRHPGQGCSSGPPTLKTQGLSATLSSVPPGSTPDAHTAKDTGLVPQHIYTHLKAFGYCSQR